MLSTLLQLATTIGLTGLAYVGVGTLPLSPLAIDALRLIVLARGIATIGSALSLPITTGKITPMTLVAALFLAVMLTRFFNTDLFEFLPIAQEMLPLYFLSLTLVIVGPLVDIASFALNEVANFMPVGLITNYLADAVWLVILVVILTQYTDQPGTALWYAYLGRLTAKLLLQPIALAWSALSNFAGSADMHKAMEKMGI